MSYRITDKGRIVVELDRIMCGSLEVRSDVADYILARETKAREASERLIEALGNLAREGCSPCEGHFECDQCAMEMKPGFFAALMAAKALLAVLDSTSGHATENPPTQDDAKTIKHEENVRTEPR